MAGEAKRKEALAGKLIIFDFSAPRVVVGRRFDAMVEGSGDPREVWAVKHAITQVANAAFSQGARGDDRKKFGLWQEDLDVDGVKAEIPWGRVDWLRGLLAKDDLATPVGISQWIEAVKSYVEDLREMVLDETEASQTDAGARA
jgi:hypothetical protein